MGATTTLLTFEEFERLPDEPGKLELLDGELIRLPPAQTPHMRISLRLYKILDNTVASLHDAGRSRDLGEVFHETGYRVGPHWLIPDVSIAHAGQPEGKYLEGAPALAVEVISEFNTADKMHRKLKRYFEYGAREVWVFYPDTKSVSVYRGKAAVEVEGMLSSELLPGISIDLSQVFG